MTEQRVQLVNRQGLHARPISRFVEVVTKSGVAVSVTGPDGTVADGRSVFSMMALAAAQGAELTLRAEGEGAEAVLKALRDLVAGGFGED